MSGRDFQRNLGPIVPRPLGAIRGWAAEPEICEIKNSLKIVIREDNLIISAARPRFMRFFSDAWGACQFSIGTQMEFKEHQNNNPISAFSYIEEILQSSVRSRHREEAVGFYDAGKLVSDLYGIGTTRGNYRTAGAQYIESGPPLAFINIEATNSPSPSETSSASQNFSGSCCPIDLTHKLFKPKQSQRFYLFYTINKNNASTQSLRAARIIMSRLYTELFVFEKLINILSGPLSAELDEKGCEEVSFRLDQCISRLIGKYRPKFISDYEVYYKLAHTFSMLHEPGKIDVLSNSLHHITRSGNMRRNALRAAAPFFDSDRGNTEESTSLDWGNNCKGGVVFMVNKYTFNGPVGAAGDHASASNFIQVTNAEYQNFDLKNLANELGSLLDAMSKEAKHADHYLELSAIAGARDAAQSRQKQEVHSSLAKTGKWALGIAEKIGVSLAAAAIKSSLNL